jgi:hypothetical protein
MHLVCSVATEPYCFSILVPIFLLLGVPLSNYALNVFLLPPGSTSTLMEKFKMT